MAGNGETERTMTVLHAKKRRRVDAILPSIPEKPDPRDLENDGPSLADLPHGVLVSIARNLERYDHLAFALTCREFLDVQREVCKDEQKGNAITTHLDAVTLFAIRPSFSRSWFRWIFENFRGRGTSPRSPLGKNYGELSKKLYDNEIMHLAGFQGDLGTIAWLQDQGVPLDIDGWRCGRGACQGGSMEVLRLLEREGWRITDTPVVCLCLAYGGHLEGLRWAKDQGCELYATHMSRAALGGHIEMIEWLRREFKLEMTAQIPRFAAQAGRLETIKYLAKEGCAVDETTAEEASKGGFVDVLEFLWAGGFPVDLGACKMNAVLHGQGQVVEWVEEAERRERKTRKV